MQITIKTTKIDLTPTIEKYIQKKMDMLDKYLGSYRVINCDVEVGMAIGSQNKGEIFRAEINLNLPGKILRVEKTEKDLYKAIDKVKDHMRELIVKHKQKIIAKKRK